MVMKEHSIESLVVYVLRLHLKAHDHTIRYSIQISMIWPLDEFRGPSHFHGHSPPPQHEVPLWRQVWLHWIGIIALETPKTCGWNLQCEVAMSPIAFPYPLVCVMDSSTTFFLLLVVDRCYQPMVISENIYFDFFPHSLELTQRIFLKMEKW